MNPRLDKLLCQRFPFLYRDRNESERVTCLCWGFECSSSWYLLIKELSKKIHNYLKTLPEERRNAFRVVQVKTKFGSLRYYVDGADKTIYKFIREAEKRSYKTCEHCGAYGKKVKLRGGGWVTTLCGKCHHNQKKRK